MSAETEEDVLDTDELVDELSDPEEPDPFCETSVEREAGMSDAEAYADRLQRMEFQRESDDTYLGLVEDLDVGDDSITLEVTAPDGSTATEEMHKPMPWSTEHKFARVVEEQGYGPGTLHMIEGERVEIERTGDGWQVHDPVTWRRHWWHRRYEALQLAGYAVAGIVAIGFASMVVLGLADSLPAMSEQVATSASAEDEALVRAMQDVLGLIPLFIMVLLMGSLLQVMARIAR